MLCTLHTPHFRLYTLDFTLHTLHSTLHTVHSTITLHTRHATTANTKVSKILRLPRKMHDIPHTTDLHQSCACHAKWTWRSPKRCACHKKCKSSSENHATALCLSQRMTFDMLWNMLECHEVPCLPHETTLRTAFAALPIGTARGSPLRSCRERLRTQ